MVMKTMILIEEERFNELLLKVEKIEKFLGSQIETSEPKSGWVTNELACKLLNVTPRTMQNYRDNGIISFSKVGSKIYYKQSDLNSHLDSHFHSAFNKGRRSE